MFTIKQAAADDEPVLLQMLFYATHMDEEPGRTLDDVTQHEGLLKYVRHWGRAGDLGYIAQEETSGQAVGAVWARLFNEADRAYSKVDGTTPELAIAVLPGYRGQGLGSLLMQHFLTEAALRYPAVALNVRADNPAVRLYQRLGFEVVGEMLNRVGTLSYDMRLYFQR